MKKDQMRRRTLKDARGVYTLFVDLEGMNAYLSCHSAPEGLTSQMLKEMLERAEINHGLLGENLDKIALLVAENLPVEMIKVAEGTPPEEGEDAHLDFQKQPVGGGKTQLEDSVENVDFREMRHFDNVQESDRIASYVPARQGVGGVDVTGKVIPPPSVDDIAIKPGLNVRYDKDSHEFFATSYGCVIFQEGKLSVNPVYEVRENVDFGHGNIRFIGKVEIRRDVLDEFQVVAEEDIDIGGTAEACLLTSGRDIRIHGGVTGKGKGRIRAKGKLSARFLNEADVICEGDVTIEREIVNSRVFTLGRLIVQRGTIVGSEVVALQGILTQNAGSELGVKTVVAAGLHYNVYEKMRSLNLELVRLQEGQQKLLLWLGEWLIEQQECKTPPESALVKRAKASMETVRDQEKRIGKLEKETGEMAREFRAKAIACVSVERQLYAGVILVTGRYEKEMKDQLRGPLSAFPDMVWRTVQMDSTLRLKEIWDGRDKGDSGFESTAVSNSIDGRKLWTLKEVEELYADFDPHAFDHSEGRILVAEDQTNMRMLICNTLAKQGYSVVGVKDGYEALSAIMEDRFDCCVLDISMPRVSGLDVLRSIRKDKRLARTPVLICTAKKEKRDILEAVQAGANGYIVKPFKLEELVQKIVEIRGGTDETDGEG